MKQNNLTQDWPDTPLGLYADRRHETEVKLFYVKSTLKKELQLKKEHSTPTPAELTFVYYQKDGMIFWDTLKNFLFFYTKFVAPINKQHIQILQKQII